MLNLDNLLNKELDGLEKNYAEAIYIADGLPFNFQQTQKQIEYYKNSKYLNAQDDEENEDNIPFYNVVNANADVSKVATDFDTKDIRVESDDGSTYDISFMFQKEIYDWMKRTNFAKTLNEMNSVRVDHGQVLVKKVKKLVDGKMDITIEIPEWQNLEVDASNILNRPIIETHYMTAAELSKKSDVWENTEEVLKLMESQSSKDGNQVKIKEINGEFPVAVYKEATDGSYADSDKYQYGRYRFFVAYVGDKRVYLHCDEQDENPYKLLEWKKVAKRPGRGVIEEGIPAQMWINDAIQKETKWFELASKAILQSASKKLKGRNLLSEAENGTVLEHEDGKPITSVPLVASAVPEFQNIIDKWKMQFDRTNAITDSVRGENPPSGQAFRLQAMVQQASTSAFDHRREEMGIFIVELFNDWILPHLAKKFNKAHILASDFTAEELKALDENYSTFNANQKAKEAILKGEIISPEDYEAIKAGYREFISQTKEKRFLDIPKNYYKDFKPRITIVTTGEQKNKTMVLESVSNVLSLYLSNPQVFQTDPFASQALAFIMEKSGAGISPISMGLGQNKSAGQLAQQGMGMPGQPAPEQNTLPDPNALAPEAVQNERQIA